MEYAATRRQTDAAIHDGGPALKQHCTKVSHWSYSQPSALQCLRVYTREDNICASLVGCRYCLFNFNLGLASPPGTFIRDHRVHCFNAGPEYKTMTQYSTCSLNFWCWHQLKAGITVSVTCFCTVKHRPMLKCGKNTASMPLKTLHFTSSTSKLCGTVRTGNWHMYAVNCTDSVTTKMEVFKGCCRKHRIRPIFTGFLVFFYPSQIRLPFGCNFGSLAV